MPDPTNSELQPTSALSRPALAFMCVLAVMACAGPGAPAPAAIDRATSLACASILPANRDLYVLEGGQTRRLTDLPGLEHHATWTPDGRHVVFTHQAGVDPDLWIVGVDGGAATPLLASEYSEDAAEVSPDGRWIAFVSDRAGTAGIWLAPFHDDRPLAWSEARLLTPEGGGSFRPTFSPDGRWVAYSTTREVPLGAGEPEWGRGSHIWLVSVASEGPEAAPRCVVSDVGWNGSPAFAADGKSLAYHQLLPPPESNSGVARAVIWEVDLTSGTRVRLSAEVDHAAWPARAPGGGWLWSEATEEGWQLVRCDAAGEAPRPVSGGRDLSTVSVSPDGRIVGHGPGAEEPGGSLLPGALSSVVPRSHAEVLLLDGAPLVLVPLRAPFPALSPDGATLATGIMSLELVDLATGARRSIFRPDDLAPTVPSVWAPDWAPDGHWLAVTAGEAFAAHDAPLDVWRVDATGENALNLTADCAASDALPSVSPDGRWIAFRSGRDGQHELYLMNADGTDVRRLTDDLGTDTMPMFAPDGRRVAFTSTRDGDHDVYILTLDEGGRPTGPPQQVTDTPGLDVHPHWSPDGEWLVVATDRYGWNDERDFEVLNIQPYGELAAIRVADGAVVRLTHNAWEEAPGTWRSGSVSRALAGAAQ